MHKHDQLYFDFAKDCFEHIAGSYSSNSVIHDTILSKDMRRAILAWILKSLPTGVGTLVPTRISRFQADVAAFWSKPLKKHGKTSLFPVKTLIVETRYNREQCWPDCANKDELLSLLINEKEKRARIEKLIRENEPGLQLNDVLFPEYESWNYNQTKNKEYHKCRQKIEEIERSLYHGSRFEKIRCALLADYLYLAVPENSVHPHELADGWGLLYIKKDLKVDLIKEADNWDCPTENKLHLIQNISSACLKSLLFAHGINFNKKGKMSFVRFPRRRLK